MAKRVAKRRMTLKAVPKRVAQVQTEAEKALARGVKATMALLPPGTRKAVRELGDQLDDAATDLRRRGRKALKAVEQGGETVADGVERVVTRLERRRNRTLKTVERESARWVAALEDGAMRVVQRIADQLDLATGADLDRLSKRLAVIERKLGGRRAA